MGDQFIRWLPRQTLTLGVACLLFLHLAGCSYSDSDSDPREAQPVEYSVVSPAHASMAPPASDSPGTESTTILRTGNSRQAATLIADDNGSFLLKAREAYWLVPGRQPRRQQLDLGVSPVLMGDQFVFWSRGAFRQAFKFGGKPKGLSKTPRQPQRIVASRGRFAWLDRDRDDRFTIQTLYDSEPRVLYATSDNITTLVMENDLVYFVEQLREGGWRIGSVALSGGKANYTSKKAGTAPSMLAVNRGLFFHEGPSSTVREVSQDLEQEKVIARAAHCSRIAVAEHLYCAQPTGLVEIGRDGDIRRELPLNQEGTITAVSANAKRVAWLTNIGGGRVLVQTATQHRGTVSTREGADSTAKSL